MTNSHRENYERSGRSRNGGFSNSLRLLVLLAVIAAVVGYLLFMSRERGDRMATDDVVRSVVGSEELILELAPRLGKLSAGMMDMRLPAAGEATAIFSDSVSVRGLAAAQLDEAAGAGVLSLHLEIAPAEAALEIPRGELELWSDLLGQVSYFESASFKLVSAEFSEGDASLFDSYVKFSGAARLRSGRWASLSAKQAVTWRNEEGEWRIVSWKMKGMKGELSGQRLFSESLDEALPNVGDRSRARYSIHHREAIKYYQSGKTRALSYDFAPIAMSQKPALSVVDIDGDGFDDLYVMVRLGKNLLLRNRGDGTFEEVAADSELAIEGHSTCAIFADFDNDGDPDLMLGRSVERCQYFENTGLWFKPVEQAVPLPYLAVSMAAADYNGDGLLDLYIATYRPGDLGDISPGSSAADVDPAAGPWPNRFLNERDAAEYLSVHRIAVKGKAGYSFLNQAGPPNVLLLNEGGGKFARPPEGEVLEVWKNSLQGTWSDFDQDGDPDLYVANDFSPDNFFRNDGGGKFVDITGEAGIDVYGFGMGASFGDYDQDGRQDLYVTNMFSKAGRRILPKFQGLRSDYLESVDGNVLYRQGGEGKFVHVSGLESPALLVAEAGWSWGGQFADFDNDTDLDIYALSGYFTAPEEVASDVDL